MVEKSLSVDDDNKLCEAMLLVVDIVVIKWIGIRQASLCVYICSKSVACLMSNVLQRIPLLLSLYLK